MDPVDGSVDRIIARIAKRQHGLVTRRQLLAAGVSATEIKLRLARGTLHAVHRGVYRVGHTAHSVEARYLAAVYACGDGAALCGFAAGHLFQVIKGTAPAPEVMATTKRTLRGVITHRARRIDPRDRTTHRAIPVTTIQRTLVDLAAHLSLDALGRAFHEAEVRRHLGPAQVEEVLKRRPNTKGAHKLRAVIHGDHPITLSMMERAFLELLTEHGLPLPVTNRPQDGHWVDCRWPTLRLTVELDSYRYHRSRYAWQQGHERERAARARGDEFRRYTYADVVEDPTRMLAELRGLIRALAPRGEAVGRC
jgi:predicted transcriptional regulator of viral defense system